MSNNKLIEERKKEWLEELKELKISKEEGLKEWIEQLKENWDKLVEEAREDLGYEKGQYDFILFRLALLYFALRRIPPATHWAYRSFKKAIKYFI